MGLDGLATAWEDPMGILGNVHGNSLPQNPEGIPLDPVVSVSGLRFVAAERRGRVAHTGPWVVRSRDTGAREGRRNYPSLAPPGLLFQEGILPPTAGAVGYIPSVLRTWPRSLLSVHLFLQREQCQDASRAQDVPPPALPFGACAFILRAC